MSQGAGVVSVLFDQLGGRDGIRKLVVHFYKVAQEDDLIGPFFAQHVPDWAAHYETVTDFWSTQTGGPALYRGGMGKHLMLGLTPAHFDRWLKVWVATARLVHGDALASQLETIGQIFALRLIQMQGGAGIRVGKATPPVPAAITPPPSA